MNRSPVFALAADAPPPHATSKALAALRNPNASAADLKAAIAGVAAEAVAAEARVDELEAERRRLLATSASDHEVDRAEEALKIAQRTWDRVLAAREELPGRLASREATENTLGKRAAKARELQQRSLGIMAELDPIAAQLSKLLGDFWNAVSEIEAANEELQRAGLQPIEWPLKALASHLGVDISELPSIGDWSLNGYYPGPAVPADRTLGRAKELLNSKGKR